MIISFDAVGARDLPYLLEKPRFGAFFQDGSFCKNVFSVYPSITYPAHTSIITGRSPAHHGVVNNTLIQPGRKKPDWMWQRRYIKGTTLFDEAIKKHMTVASLFWPVTAQSKVTYNVPEVLANKSWENQVFVSLLNGTPLYELDLVRRFGSALRGIHQPELDTFTHASALYTLERYQPDLMMIHYTDVDTNRHEYGLDGEKITAALDRHEVRLKELEDKLRELGIYENTTMVILGDHCQMDVHTIVYPNAIFRKKGWINVKNGKISDWKVLCHEADGSCYIYVKDSKLKTEVEGLLRSLVQKENSGIEAVYTSQEVEKMGADPACTFMVEAEPFYYFQDDTEVFQKPISKAEGSAMRATHGYRPDKPGYQTFFAMRGKSIRKNHEISQMQLIDEGPTMASVLGVDLGKTDGQCKMEIFNR